MTPALLAEAVAAIPARYDPTITLGTLLVVLGQLVAFVVVIWRIGAWKATTDLLVHHLQESHSALAVSMEALVTTVNEHLRGHPTHESVARHEDIVALRREIDRTRRANGG